MAGSGGIVAFTCPACGGATTFAHGGLVCASCGRRSTVPRAEGEIRTRGLHDLLMSGDDERPAIPDELTYQLVCPRCGGGATYGGTLRASRCPFCAAPVARYDVHEPHGRLSVDGVVPFVIDEHQARQALRRWVTRSMLAPRRFRLHTGAASFARVYLPVIAIDADLSVDLVDTGGRILDTVAYEARDVVVTAGSTVDQEQIYRLSPWDLTATAPYRPEYLAGAFCASYDLSLAEISTLVDDRLQDAGKVAQLRLKSQRNLGIARPETVDAVAYVDDGTYRHLLLPVFLSLPA